MPKTLAARIAIGFFIFWLLVLLAGADKPPPPGFIFIIILDVIAAFLVYRRVPIYILWYHNKQKSRWVRVIIEGSVIGLLMGGLTMLFSGGGDPSLPPATIFDRLIWFGVLGMMGIVNSLAVYLTAVFFSKRIAK